MRHLVVSLSWPDTSMQGAYQLDILYGASIVEHFRNFCNYLIIMKIKIFLSCYQYWYYIGTI